MKVLKILPTLMMIMTASPALCAETRYPFTIRSGSYDSSSYDWMRSDITKFLEEAENTEHGLIRIEALVKILRRLAHQAAMKEDSPAARQTVAIKVFGAENHKRLEDYFLELMQSDDGERAEVAIVCLSQCLFSIRSKEAIRRKLDEAMKDLVDGDPTKSPDPKILFATAEGLTYLDDPAGLEVLPPFLGPRFPTTYRIRAMRALANFEQKVDLPQLLGHLLEEEDADVAYRAFEILEASMQNETPLYEAALGQLKRLAEKIATGASLDFSEAGLLNRAANVLSSGYREGALSEQQIADARKDAKEVVVIGSMDEAGGVAALFAYLAKDEDADIIQSRMLESQSWDLRWKGVLAVTRCSKEVQKKFVPMLLQMLDDDNQWVRGFALHALRTYMGEKASTAYTEKEFQEQSARVRRELGQVDN